MVFSGKGVLKEDREIAEKLNELCVLVFTAQDITDMHTQTSVGGNEIWRTMLQGCKSTGKLQRNLRVPVLVPWYPGARSNKPPQLTGSNGSDVITSLQPLPILSS